MAIELINWRLEKGKTECLCAVHELKGKKGSKSFLNLIIKTGKMHAQHDKAEESSHELML
jgi:hypothetical protein